MKNNLKRSIKILVLCFALTLVNCENDDEFRENISQTENTNNLIVKRITINDIKANNDLQNTFNKINKFLDISKLNDVNAKVNSTDGSFTILTDEILEATTNNSEAYTFRIETPIHPESTFENFVLERRGEQENFHIYIYSYKTFTFSDNSEFTFVISLQEVDEGLINMNNFHDVLNSKMLMFSNCLYEVDENDDPIGEPIWCFGSGNSGSSGINSGTNTYNGYGEWVYFNPDGVGDCIRTRTITIDGVTTTETQYGVPCPNNTNDSDSNSNGNDDVDEDNNDNTDNVNDPHFNDDFESTSNSSGSATNNGNTSTVGALPPETIDLHKKY